MGEFNTSHCPITGSSDGRLTKVFFPEFHQKMLEPETLGTADGSLSMFL
jgi:hypothetical protein